MIKNYLSHFLPVLLALDLIIPKSGICILSLKESDRFGFVGLIEKQNICLTQMRLDASIMIKKVPPIDG